MAATALAQEKVWVEKPSYDKAECLFHERAAKLGTYCKKVSRKNVDQCLLNPNNCSSAENATIINSNNQTKSKSKKSKDNKALDNVSNETAQNVKNQKKNSKSIEKNEEPVSEKQVVLETKPKEQEIIPNVSSKKLKLKEAKEKKNKADKKSRNKDEDKINFQESKEKLVSQKVGIEDMAKVPSDDVDSSCLTKLEKRNEELESRMQELLRRVEKLEMRMTELEKSQVPTAIIAPKCAFVKKGTKTPLGEPVNLFSKPVKKETKVETKKVEKEEEDEDVDLFGSDSEGEDAEAARIREERLAAYNAKKSKKPALIAKSNIILDVKPWDDETDMKAMEAEVRKIVTDGLLWGAAKLVPLAYGIHKLQISCVVEDDKVSIDWLTEQIQEIEDFVQSVDIAAFNKV